jgi:hypothetical protein
VGGKDNRRCAEKGVTGVDLRDELHITRQRRRGVGAEKYSSKKVPSAKYLV